MTPPREPFFKPEAFKGLEISSHGAEKCADIANRLVEPLLNLSTGLQSENNRLRDELSQLLDDKTHLQTELLKTHSENERLREENETLREMKVFLGDEQREEKLEAELDAFKAEIEQAPVVYLNRRVTAPKVEARYWTEYENDLTLDGPTTHKARLVRIEEIGK